MEPSNLFESNGLRPDGVSLVPYKKGKSVTWDFTCPHPLCLSHLPRDNINESAESKKVEKYTSLAENYIFIPISIDTFGRYGPQQRNFSAKSEGDCRKNSTILEEPLSSSRTLQLPSKEAMPSPCCSPFTNSCTVLFFTPTCFVFY